MSALRKRRSDQNGIDDSLQTKRPRLNQPRKPRIEHYGVVFSIDGETGIIRDNLAGQKTIRFSISSYINFGLINLIPGDEVSFYIANSLGTKSAINVKLTKCSFRPADVIEDYIYQRLNDSRHADSKQLERVALAVTCTPVWTCIGECQHLSDDSLSALVTLLLELSKIDNMRQNLSAMMEKLLQSDLFEVTQGRFIVYVKHIVESGVSSKKIADVRTLIQVLLKFVPSQATQLVELVSPMVSREEQSCEHFLYSLLKQVVRSSTAIAENTIWSSVALVPSVGELLRDNGLDSSLRRVSTDRPYQSVNVYMDTYFRLLRADCMSSLTDGVTKLLGGCLDTRDMNVFGGVQLAGIHMSHRGGLMLAVTVKPRFAASADFNLFRSSKLMYGNLLCVSVSGTFEDPIWATVVNRDLLDKFNIVVVELCSERNTRTDDEIISDLRFAGEKTVIVESPTYYRAYQPILKSLQELTPEDMTFQEELIECKPHGIPDYIKQETEFDSKVLSKSTPWTRCLFEPMEANADADLCSNTFCDNEQETERLPAELCSPVSDQLSHNKHEVSMFRQHARQKNKLNLLEYCLNESAIGETNLDPSQEIALKQCFLNRVAIVQGPPGTGKTYIGVKLAQMILSLSTYVRLPILILTYKNHALDEFLKALLPHCPKKMARVGGRSRETCLDHCNISTLCKESRRSEDLQQQIMQLSCELAIVLEEVEKAFDDVFQPMFFEYKMMTKYLSDDQIVAFLNNCDWNRADPNVFSIFEGYKNVWMNSYNWRIVQIKNIENVIDRCLQRGIWRVINEPSEEERELSSQINALLKEAVRMWSPKQQEYVNFERNLNTRHHANEQRTRHKAYCEVDDSKDIDEKDVDELIKERLASSGAKLCETKDILESVEKYRVKQMHQGGLYMGDLRTAVAREIHCKCSVRLWLDNHNIWTLSKRERIQLVQYILYETYLEDVKSKQIDSMMAEYHKLRRKKQELEDLHKANILKDMNVVGMTITGANINRGIVAQVKPAVVIVEEAAEILEPQLTAILGNWTQHLILIGDHKQLRPPVENHILARDFHFDISMMERLITNKLPYATLTLQNRMLPEFAGLLLDIYPDLQTNMDVVCKNTKPACCQHSMYFWHQSNEETPDRSYTNETEAQCALTLGLFLIEQGHKPRKITILSPYLGQAKLLRRKLREAEQSYSNLFPDLEDSRTTKKEESAMFSSADNTMQVHTIDTYQGDENDVIIISLVRSNQSGDIGFLKKLGRRCVAQSRARCGLYFIGNRLTLSRHDTWKRLIDGMDNKGCAGNSFPYCCPRHTSNPESQSQAKTADELPVRFAFCKLICDYKFKLCQHVCEKTCQPVHRHVKCEKVVQFKCSNVSCGIMRRRKCFQYECEIKCLNQIEIVLGKCGHSCKKPCHQEETTIICNMPCPKILDCSHQCPAKCGETCETKTCKECEAIRLEEARRRREAEKAKIIQVKKHSREKLKELKEKSPVTGVHIQELTNSECTAAEYCEINERILRHAQRVAAWFPRITCIEKVTNFQSEIKWLQKLTKAFDPTRIEHYFYCTEKKTSDEIIKNGFKLSGVAKSLAFKGKGIRFTDEIYKKLTAADSETVNVVLDCEVLVGKACSVDLTKPKEWTAESLRHEHYDSLFVKKSETRSIKGLTEDNPCNQCIIWDNRQAIPRYRIYYEAVESSSMTTSLEQEAMKLTTVSHHHILAPKRGCDMSELEKHFRWAESQFLRLTKPIHGRCYKVDSIDYYLNPGLMKKFGETHAEMKATFGEKSEESKIVWGFHGTPDVNIESIIENNFDITKLSEATGSRGKYGAGIYFSEFPDFSIAYAKPTGDSGRLLLCQLLPGKSFDCHGYMYDQQLERGFNSHRAVIDSEGRGKELVIFSGDQILPCYVVNYSCA